MAASSSKVVPTDLLSRCENYSEPTCACELSAFKERPSSATLQPSLQLANCDEVLSTPEPPVANESLPKQRSLFSRVSQALLQQWQDLTPHPLAMLCFHTMCHLMNIALMLSVWVRVIWTLWKCRSA
jgi:hypothetical protein